MARLSHVFNQGNKPYSQDVKKDMSKIEVEIQEIVQKVGDDTETKNGFAESNEWIIADVFKAKKKTPPTPSRLTPLYPLLLPFFSHRNRSSIRSRRSSTCCVCVYG